MIPKTWLGRVLLGAIVAVALAVRLRGITFGLPLVTARPDELVIVATVLRFFSQGSLNPHFFDYPGLFLYIVATIYGGYYLTGRALGWFTSVPHFVGGTHGRWPMLYFLNRFASALFGTFTTLAVYRIGRLLFDETTALLSALFLALAFLHVRDSHYGTTDAALTFFTMWAMVALVRLHIDRRRAHAVSAAVFAGLAMGTKYNSLLLVAPMVAVEALFAGRLRDDWRALVRRSYLPLMLVVMGVTFLATSPFLILDYQGVLRDFAELRRSMTLGMTPPELLGPGWIYHARFSLLHGVGLPLLLAALAGAMTLAMRQPSVALILLAYPTVYYIVAGRSGNLFVRYMVPVVPFVCVFAAYCVRTVAAVIAPRVRMREGVAAAVLGVAVVSPTAWSTLQFDQILSQRDSRLIAGDWIHEHVPFGTTVFLSGNSYGFPPLEDRANPKWRLIGWDWKGMGFVEHGRGFNGWPDWIVVQQSALPYSHIPAPVEAKLGDAYTLTHVITAGDMTDPRNVYDIQDGFYMPYGGFKNIRRPGPNYEIYRRIPASGLPSGIGPQSGGR